MEDILNLRYALDTLYFLVMGAFVMWMAAGFSMLEAGLVRAKNTTEILTKNVALYAIACIMYMLIGYNLMYPGDSAVNSIWPGISFLLGNENDPAAVLSATGESWYDGSYYSGRSDFFFQVVFVATAMSIVSGAVAERMKLWPFLTFCVVLTGFIYPIQGFWKWGGGFLDEMGFSDFAGSGVVHLTGATAALAGVWLVGARKGKYSKDGKVQALPGANLPLATLGTFILWMGWFGFNGGSELVVSSVSEANAVAAIFVNTNAAAAGGVVAALLTAKLVLGRADLTMVLNGALAGLVAITAEPLAPSPLAATLIGAVGGLIVVLSVLGLDRLRIDDPVGAISVHGVVGIWGLLAVPITNSDASVITQIIGAAVIFGFVLIASL
ncbi:MAG: ammonium transporter, partial [Gammaproteobacteria bacterium]